MSVAAVRLACAACSSALASAATCWQCCRKEERRAEREERKDDCKGERREEDDAEKEAEREVGLGASWKVVEQGRAERMVAVPDTVKPEERGGEREGRADGVTYRLAGERARDRLPSERYEREREERRRIMSRDSKETVRRGV